MKLFSKGLDSNDEALPLLPKLDNNKQQGEVNLTSLFVTPDVAKEITKNLNFSDARNMVLVNEEIYKSHQNPNIKYQSPYQFKGNEDQIISIQANYNTLMKLHSKENFLENHKKKVIKNVSYNFCNDYIMPAKLSLPCASTIVCGPSAFAGFFGGLFIGGTKVLNLGVAGTAGIGVGIGLTTCVASVGLFNCITKKYKDGVKDIEKINEEKKEHSQFITQLMKK